MLTQTNFSNDVVVIPPLPRIEKLLWELKHATHGNYQPEFGAHLDIGDIIYKQETYPVIAPVKGQFRGTQYSYDTGEMKNFLSSKGLKEGISDGHTGTYCFFSTLNGQPKDFTRSDFYDFKDIQKKLGKYINEKKPLPGRLHGNDLFRKNLIFEFEKMTEEPLLVVPVSEMPRVET